MRTLQQYGMGIAYPSEGRLSDSELRVTPITEVKTAYHLYHSGVTHNIGQFGVAIAYLTPLEQTRLLQNLAGVGSSCAERMMRQNTSKPNTKQLS